MKPILKILLLLLPVFANAQFDPNWGYVSPQQADSLRKSLSIGKNDTLLMAANRSLGFYYQEIKLDSGLYFHQQQLKLATKLNIKMWMADAYSQLGYMFLAMNDITQGYSNFMEAQNIADDKKNENSNWHPWVFSNAQNMQDARLAILAMNYNGLGNLFYAIDEKIKSKDAFTKSLQLGKQIKNGKIISAVYGNMLSDLPVDSMILYAKKAIQYGDESGYKKNLGGAFLNIARGFYLKNELDSAKQYVYYSVNANIEQNNIRLLSYSYWAFSSLYALQQNPDSSLFYAKKALVFAESIKAPEIFLNTYTALAAAYRLQKNTDSAFKYQQLAYNLNDSLKNVKIKQLTNFQKSAFNEQIRLNKLNDEKTASQNRLKLYSTIGGLIVALFIALILYRNNRQKQKANTLLKDEKQKVDTTLAELKATQQQLIQSEKMASLGELTAGIAHEIQNPLNFVNNFSEVSTELIDEMKDEMTKGNDQLANEIADDLKQNLEKINHHGKRAGEIVKGMLQHSRSGTGQKELTDINALCDEYLRLAYHGLRAKDKTFNAEMKTEFDESIGNINIVPQDIGRVVLNLISNAFYAASLNPSQGGTLKPDSSKTPTVWVKTKKEAEKILISVGDNGSGIPKEILDKIFQPFFTTKPTGQGTGLGLSLSYDIVKAHGGEIKVETKEGEGSEFIIQLPVA